MIDGFNKSVINLADNEWQEALQLILNNIVLFDDINNALNFYNNLGSLFEKKHVENGLSIELVNNYKLMISMAGWIAITSLRNDQILDIIDNNFIDLLKNDDLDLWEKLLSKLRSILILEDRDDLKEEIKNILKKNNFVLTKNNIFLNGNNTRGTIANWLFYYDFLISNKKKGSLLEEVLGNDQYIKLLLPQEKNYVRKLFHFYEKLQFSSFSFEGIEDYIFVSDGKESGWFRQGVYTSEKYLEKTNLKIKNADNILKNALGSQYKDFFRENFEIENIEKVAPSMSDKNLRVEYVSEDGDRLLKKYKLSSVDWKKTLELKDQYDKDNKLNVKFGVLHLAINNKNKEEIIGFLMSLAGFGFLDEIFERDAKIKDIFKAHLTKKFSEKLAKHFEQNLREPVYLSYFLQHVLKDILKLDENESAVLAIKLVNELKRAGDKQYLPIAYGDLKEGVFKWKAIIEKDDTLELER